MSRELLSEETRFIGMVGSIVDLKPLEMPWWLRFQQPVSLTKTEEEVWCVFDQNADLQSVHKTREGAMRKCDTLLETTGKSCYYVNYELEK